MDRTKIPKPSQLRPPKIIIENVCTAGAGNDVNEHLLEKKCLPKTALTRMKTAVDTIPEGKLYNREAGTVKKNPATSFPKPFLRRRSKSVSDLRAVGISKTALTEKRKPLVSRAPPQAAATKAVRPIAAVSGRATKRSAEKDSNEDVKPKMPKVKIPDWDYKSRFNLLNEKHTGLQHKLKDAEKRLSDLATVEEDFTNIKQDASQLRTKVQSLTQKINSMSQELSTLKTDNKDLKGKLQTVTSDYETLSDEHTNLKTEHEALTENTKTIRKHCADLENELSDLKAAHQTLTANHEDLISSNNLLRLEFDTKVRENEILEQKLSEAQHRIGVLEGETGKQKGEIIASESLRRQLHNTIQDLKGNIRVFCRVRPPVTVMEADQLQCYLNYADECSLEIRKCRESMSISGKLTDCKLDFTFDHVFAPESTQEEVFTELAQLIQSALDGYHVCVFAYGQTGSGKTFTMQGEVPNNLGMIPRSIDLIFETIEKMKMSGWTYTVQASFLEIYNEAINDLLDPASKATYDIRFNEGKGTTVTNLRIETISSAAQLKALMTAALQNRAVASTNFNEQSSRSHAITKVYLQGTNADSNVSYTGSVNLVDLAGSESAKTSSGERLTETKSINKSLSTLGNVMLALHNRDPHVPYRNSKLTYLLQSCLGGNSKTLMFVNISPFDECYNESVNSLRFASKVKEVKTGSKRNKNYNGSAVGSNK